MSDADYLPLEAVPYFVRLLTLYNKSLQELIEMFHAQKNEAAFAKLLDHLVSDFDYYQESYVYWQKQAQAPAEHNHLKALEPLLAEAKQLIAEAIALARH